MIQPVLPTVPIRSPRSEAKRKEREARSIAIEKAYVHDVYEQISQHVSDNKYRAWPRVKQFLQDLEPGTLLCDVGKERNKKSCRDTQCLKKAQKGLGMIYYRKVFAMIYHRALFQNVCQYVIIYTI